MKWSGESGHACEDQQHKHPYMIDGHLLKLNMRRPVYELHYNQTSGGTIYGVPSAGSAGTVFNLSASPSAQYTLNTYSVTGAELTGNAGTFVNSDVTAQASWTYHPAPKMVTTVKWADDTIMYVMPDGVDTPLSIGVSATTFHSHDGAHGEYTGVEAFRQMTYDLSGVAGRFTKVMPTKVFVNADNVKEPDNNNIKVRFVFSEVSALANEDFVYFRDSGHNKILNGYAVAPSANASLHNWTMTNAMSAGINLAPGGHFSAGKMSDVVFNWYTDYEMKPVKTGVANVSGYALDKANSRIKFTYGNQVQTFNLTDPKFKHTSAFVNFNSQYSSYSDYISGTIKFNLADFGYTAWDGNSTMNIDVDLRKNNGNVWSASEPGLTRQDCNSMTYDKHPGTTHWSGAFWVVE